MNFVDIEIVDLDLSKTTWSRVHSAMRTLYLRLTREPETGWVRFFHEERESRIVLKRHGLWIEDGYIVFDCLLDDVEQHHLPDFRLSVEYANTKYAEFLEARREAGELARDDVRAEEEALMALRARIRGEGNAPAATAVPLRTTSAHRDAARITSLTASKPAAAEKTSDSPASLNGNFRAVELAAQSAAAASAALRAKAAQRSPPAAPPAAATEKRAAAVTTPTGSRSAAAQIPSDPLFAKKPVPAASFEALARAAAQATTAAQALEASALQAPPAEHPVEAEQSAEAIQPPAAETAEVVPAAVEPASTLPQDASSAQIQDGEAKAIESAPESPASVSADVADFNAKREEWRARFRAALAASREKESARGND